MMKRWFCWPWRLPKIEPNYREMEAIFYLERLEMQLWLMERDDRAHELRLLHDDLWRIQHPGEHLGRT